VGLFSKLFGGNRDDEQRQIQQIRQQFEHLNGQIITDDETGETFQIEIEVLPKMSYEDFVALCESLKRQ